MLNGSSEEEKNTVLISHPVTNIQANGLQMILCCNGIPFCSCVLWALHQFSAREHEEYDLTEKSLGTDGERIPELSVSKLGTTTSLIRFRLSPFNKIRLISQLHLCMLKCTYLILSTKTQAVASLSSCHSAFIGLRRVSQAFWEKWILFWHIEWRDRGLHRKGTASCEYSKTSIWAASVLKY